MAYGLSMGSGEEKYYPDPIHAIEITDVLDLHVFAPRDVGVAVEAYLEEAFERGYRHVRIIHGKGIGQQRERVRKILGATAFVEEFGDAPMEAGGWGATLVTLAKKD
jgi:dsDNA-specific endonuclease/ATPase MutS2